MSAARRYVASFTESDDQTTFDVYLKDTKLDLWATMASSASPEPTFTLMAEQTPLLTVAASTELMVGVVEALGASYKVLGELAVMLMRRDLEASVSSADHPAWTYDDDSSR